MKITKTITTVEEVPFDWKELKNHIFGLDWFNPDDSDDWEWFIDYLIDYLEYSNEDIEEVKKHKNEIAEIMHKRRKEEVSDELYWQIGNNLENFINSEYKITEEEIHNYITNWFKENSI